MPIYSHCDKALIGTIQKVDGDDTKGGWLPADLVAEGRALEMEYVRKHGVYERVPRSQCHRETGRPPIRTGWADTNKGTSTEPNIRCRWVAKEFRTHADPELFAPTPPLEGVKMVISMAASTGNADTVLLIVDVRRAYFYARAQRRLFVELPPEDYQPGDESTCGLLKASLYGTRDAAANWELELGGFLSSIGLKKGKGSPCLLTNAEGTISAGVHGDDVVVAASRRDAAKILSQFQVKYETKHQMLGSHPDLAKEGSILNRKLTWTSRGIRMEADPRHAREVVVALGLDRGNGVSTPCAAEKADDAAGRHRGGGRTGGSSIACNVAEEVAREGEPLPEAESTRFRAVAARCNYLAQDRPDIRIAHPERLISRSSSGSADNFSKYQGPVSYTSGSPRQPRSNAIAIATGRGTRCPEDPSLEELCSTATI